MDRRPLVALLFAAAASGAIVGYFEFRFLTDDAYISFRYVSNLLAGRGLVWNPPPFLPVEGYTNFAWVVLLGGVWAVTGIEPPVAANPIALVLGLGTLGLALRIALRMPLPASYERIRLPLAALAMLGIVTNRTFLAWLSSGLETSLFNFAITAWVACALEPPASRALRTTLGIAASAALAALTRPDGWLTVLACAPLAIGTWRARGRFAARDWLAWSPLLLPVLHLAWRRSYYGEWLPNTWYAKHLGAWPESGVRYAASFALENAVWIWLALVIAWLARRPRPAWHRVVVVGTLLAHFSYYTFVIGGDHFEYRVYSHLVPLLFVSAAWLAGAIGASPTASLATLALFVAASWPIPWAHHLATRELRTREATHELVEPVAPHLPAPLSWLAEPFDTLQAWLIPRHVGMRHREHAVYHRTLVSVLPSRERGARVRWEERAVVAAVNPGVVGWVFPNVAVIDRLGLNDHVVARMPPAADGDRDMAHDRWAPPDYVACFRPNVSLELTRRFSVVERATPLLDQDIVRCERLWRVREGEPRH